MSKANPDTTSLRMTGAGDGARNHCHKLEKRMLKRSARVFTPTPVKTDHHMQLKLKNAIEELESKPLELKKAKSMAEITPTKTRPKQRVKRADTRLSETLHATPRPLDDGPTPSRRKRMEFRAYQNASRRWLLFCWRHGKERLADLSDSLRRHQDQIVQLERQIVVLKDLRLFECDKRQEAIGECQKLKNELEFSAKEIEDIGKEKSSLENELRSIRSSLKTITDDFLNTKNDLSTRNVRVEELESEVQQMQEEIEEVIGQKGALIDKIAAQETGMKSLREKLEISTSQLENEKISKVGLEEKLSQYCKDIECFAVENEQLKGRIAELESRNLAKELTTNSLCTLKRILYLLLPAYDPFSDE